MKARQSALNSGPFVTVAVLLLILQQAIETMAVTSLSLSTVGEPPAALFESAVKP